MTLWTSILRIPPLTRVVTTFSVIICMLVQGRTINLSLLSCHPAVIIPGWVQPFLFKVENAKSYLDYFTATTVLLAQIYRFFLSFLVPSGVYLTQGVTRDMLIVFDIYLMYNFSGKLEGRAGKFKGRTLDCLWFVFISGLTIMVTSYVIYGLAFVSSYTSVLLYLSPQYHLMMLSCVTYLWSRENKGLTVTFYGLFPIKAYYLPLFHLATNFMTGGYVGMYSLALGIWGGYIYQCIQSGTVPIYNLLPLAYPSYMYEQKRKGRRLHEKPEDEVFENLIFDNGYLEAPAWLYRITNTSTKPPVNVAGSVTSVTDINGTGSGATRHETHSNFRGKGQKLGT